MAGGNIMFSTCPSVSVCIYTTSMHTGMLVDVFPDRLTVKFSITSFTLTDAGKHFLLTYFSFRVAVMCAVSCSCDTETFYSIVTTVL